MFGFNKTQIARLPSKTGLWHLFLQSTRELLTIMDENGNTKDLEEDINVEITADGNQNQSNATQLREGYSKVENVSASGDAVKLPSADFKGKKCVVQNAGGNSMDVYPSSGESINNMGDDTALSVGTDTTTTFVVSDAGSNTWESF